jgi:FMN phosphatase YigB (HAD superfamily)
LFQTTNSEQFTYPAFDEIERRLRSGAIEALTTDVFDTVVWRTVPEPTDVFVLLGQALRDRGALDASLSPRTFACLRERAEIRAREALRIEAGSPEVRLDEIWERVPEWCHRPLSRTEALRLEVETERQVLVPDLDVVGLLRVANEIGVPVHAVSDTYFSAEQLQRLLEQPLLEDVAFEEVFTSSDRRVSKVEELFDRVLASIGCAPELVAHLGDNRDADVGPARARRMTAAHVPRRRKGLEHLLRRESAYRRVRALAAADDREAARADVADLDGSLVQLRAKMALRREAEDTPGALRPMWLYGAEVLGPPLAGFADWAVGEGERLGVRRLHCLMREGDFLGELIERSAAASGSEIEAVKLFLNRQVTAIASIGEGSREEVGRLLLRRQATTTRELLEMLGIDSALAPACVGHLDAKLDEGTRLQHTLDAIWEDEGLRLRVQAHARSLRERIVRLAERQHDGSDGPFVVVDLGWAASIQLRLSEILAQSGAGMRIDGLYLLTHAGAIDSVARGGRVSGFLASFGHPSLISDAVLRSPEVLEQVCMAEHGTQVGLTEELEPVLAELGLPPAQLLEAAAVRDGIRAFQRAYLRYRSEVPAKVRSLGSSPAQLAPIVARACADPTTEEALRFGAWHHDAGQGSSETEPLAGGPLTEWLRHLDPEQVRATSMADGYWPNAVARLHDPHVADLSAAHAAGLLSPGASTAELETGEMAIEATAGVGIDPTSAAVIVPRRNRHGLSFVRATLRGAHVERLRIRLGTRPVLIRVDGLLLRLHLKDSPEVLTVRLERPDREGMLECVNVTRISDQVFAGTADHSYLGFATSRVAGSRTVYRVEVELSFMALAWDAQTAGRGGLGMEEAERHLEAVVSSASWRLTRPLRGFKKRLRAG